MFGEVRRNIVLQKTERFPRENGFDFRSYAELLWLGLSQIDNKIPFWTPLANMMSVIQKIKKLVLVLL
jgi:hypothetical protein